MASRQNTLFIGYASLEALHEEMNYLGEVNVLPVREPGKPGQFGVSVETSVVVVSWVSEAGHVHYCRLRAGQAQLLQGQPFDAEASEAVTRRAEGLSSLVCQWLMQYGYRVRPALVAVPTDLKMLEGHADFLRYDKETDSFTLRGADASQEVA